MTTRRYPGGVESLRSIGIKATGAADSNDDASVHP